MVRVAVPPWSSFAFQQACNADNSSSLVRLSLPSNPLGDDGTAWVHYLRHVLDTTADAQASSSGARYYLVGEAAEIVDSKDLVLSLFPWVVAATVGVVFVACGVYFRSLFVPLRLVLSIALPLSAVFGTAQLLFGSGDAAQHVPNAAARWFPALTDVHALYWLTPVMCFSLLCGLALDYDLFLFACFLTFSNPYIS